LMDIVLDKFADPAGGGLFYTASDHEQLIARTKELTDSSIPSGNSLAANALLRLGRLLGHSDYLDAAEQILAAGVPIMQRVPMAAGQMLLALDLYLGPANELVLVGDMGREDTKQAIAAVHRRHLPRSVFAARDTHSADPTGSQSGHLNEIFEGKESEDGQPVLYVCEKFSCGAPAIGLRAIEMALDALRVRRVKDGSAV
jgi:uncharacterized protein